MIKQWCQGDWEVLLTHIEDKLECQWQICLQADESHSLLPCPHESAVCIIQWWSYSNSQLSALCTHIVCLLVLRYINLFYVMSDSNSKLHADSYMAQSDLWFCRFMGRNMPKNINQLSHVQSQGDYHYGLRCCQVFFQAVTYFLTFPFAN